ncbi:hypothetical protein TWF102_001862 [Orbilia oligospora]|uniref:Uncharacterized protein n=1 Tax=Orbilia oligospora TaxID=2813651 RepID=A0A7C8NT00_ORBOL|nr:hypothetical protein TWF103_001902 [Orbilia oligospora]KAF3105961.1 hypothetical protein TWF102_001862 [Orbilia oligospora]
MSLLDQDIPSAGHTCSRCNTVFGHGMARARHVHERDRGLYNDGPRKVSVFINPSKRPYVTPFRRVQTLNRLLEYLGTLPHPQIRVVTNASGTTPPLQIFEQLLFSGQWQLVDSSGCVIRPDDYEDLIHDGMEITIDTVPEGQQDEPTSLLQPLGVSGGKSTRSGGPQSGRDEVAGDLLDMQINEPIARQRLNFETEQYSYTQSKAPVTRFNAASSFSSIFGGIAAVDELEGEEIVNPHIIAPTSHNLPLKSASWYGGSKTGAMSASAAEFKPSGDVKLSTAASEFKPSGQLQVPTSSSEDPHITLPQGQAKRSMAIPIVKPPSPALDMIAAPKPDMPITSYDDEEEDYGDWDGKVAATMESEKSPGEEEEAAVPDTTEEWSSYKDEADNRRDDLSIDIAQTKSQEHQLSPPTEDIEIASVSDTIVGSGPRYEESQIYSPPASGRSTPTPTDGGNQNVNMSPPLDPVSLEDQSDNESNLLKSEILEPKHEVPESSDTTVAQEEKNATTDGQAEESGEDDKEKSIQGAEEMGDESAPAKAQSSAEMLAVLMSGVEFTPAGDTGAPGVSNDNMYKWEEAKEFTPTEEPGQSEIPNPTTESWDTTTSPGGDFHGTGWGDWSTKQTFTVDDNQWDNRGHVRRDSEGDAEWGPPKPKEPEHIDPPKPAKSGWAQVAAAGLPSHQSSTNPSPSHPFPTSPRPAETPVVKKPTTTSNSVGLPMTFPPRPGSSNKNSNSQMNGKQKRGAVPCKFMYFVPPHNCSIPNATNSNKISLVQTTAIRKLAVLYAKHFKETRLVSRFEGNQNHILELSISRSENGPVTKHKVDLESKLIEHDFGNEFWVSINYLGQGSLKRV